MLIGLSLLFSACASLPGRTARLPLPECPPETVSLQAGWLGQIGGEPFRIPLKSQPGLPADGRQAGVELLMWGMLAEDRVALERWIVDWQTCAKARGAVIEEVNK